MHARDDERRAQELAWFDAYRHGQGMPDLAPHELYATAQEYDWDRARLTVLGYEVIESWRHEQEDGRLPTRSSTGPTSTGCRGRRGSSRRSEPTPQLRPCHIKHHLAMAHQVGGRPADLGAASARTSLRHWPPAQLP